jgi:hypothetical protein
MAVRAIHEPFVDPMLEGHGELSANFGVAAVAKIGLFFRQQEFRSWRLVDGMAAGANDFVEGMSRPADICAAQSFGVTSKTVVEDVLGWELRESDDGSFAAMGVDMGFAGSVTAFASGPFSRFLTGCDAFVVRILVEPGENVGMTSPANGAAHVGRIGYRLRDRQDWRTKY